MPSVTISVNKLASVTEGSGKPLTVTTELGSTIIEIQGDLQIPSQRPQEAGTDPEHRFVEHEGRDILRFGEVSYDMETKKACMYVGRKQRLLGTVVKLDPPLGILRFRAETSSVELEDVIRYKLLFKDRPLPII
ncbi:AER166Cp [Eremothecium gossypii ATCC 10895]|uniref:AER166Cp n=1 Tax=Eremothecium gossypii (strain ATCC 10895 / CBS 109.51 / FGSC 9923 / NRRL Y-1056) TaxID=284811 RepID=Q756T7_EREGS|nr:AER166Cp [Eremothecium gossypii ATCC 10895]AAS52848.1 AER166Cp [Eremothecium gossypii ATCC 10895]AEY97155.1 FAER166Cp [Eremothecium gossypii FDAG1]